MRYAWILAVAWVVYLAVALTVAGLDIRDPFEFLGDVL